MTVEEIREKWQSVKDFLAYWWVAIVLVAVIAGLIWATIFGVLLAKPHCPICKDKMVVTGNICPQERKLAGARTEIVKWEEWKCVQGHVIWAHGCGCGREERLKSPCQEAPNAQ